MFEGRMKSTGWGFVGSGRKGYEWLFTPSSDDVCYQEDPATGKPYTFCGCRSGYVFRSREKAVAEGKKWMKECGRCGTVRAVEASPKRFEY